MLTMLRSLRLSRRFAALAVRRSLRMRDAAAAGGEHRARRRFVVGDHWEYLVTDGLRRGRRLGSTCRWSRSTPGVATMRLVKRRQLRPQRANRRRSTPTEACASARLRQCRSPALFAFAEAARFSDRPTQLLAPDHRYVSQRHPARAIRSGSTVEVQGRAPVTVPGRQLRCRRDLSHRAAR